MLFLTLKVITNSLNTKTHVSTNYFLITSLNRVKKSIWDRFPITIKFSFDIHFKQF